ncbi:MAG TPA: Rho termination factor N-terminal domain-containing protein, partial [Luteimonas sp.]|nr:Rho termination factor N-terminal domain-containing protein [Luteimonas sp.]
MGESGETAEKRVRKPRASRANAPDTSASDATGAKAAEAPRADAPAASEPAPASDNGGAQQAGNGGNNGNGGNAGGQGSEGREGGGRHGSRRDRFRNRRNRDRHRDDGLPRDDNGNEPPQNRPMPNIPEGFPQYSLGDLKRMPAQKLLDIAEQLGISETVARARKQDVIFALLKVLTRTPEGVAADGVLEILPDGFGFLRAAEASYLAGPDDTYISPSQIRRFNLRTGDHLSGRIRWPKDGERYFALNVVDEINGEPIEASKNKVLFENLTPLFPRKRFRLERGDGSTEDITGRILDL